MTSWNATGDACDTMKCAVARCENHNRCLSLSAMKYLIALLCTFACLPALAAAPDFFPLQAGNQWVYRTGGTRTGDPLILEITQARDFDGVTRYLLHGMRN